MGASLGVDLGGWLLATLEPGSLRLAAVACALGALGLFALAGRDAPASIPEKGLGTARNRDATV